MASARDQAKVFEGCYALQHDRGVTASDEPEERGLVVRCLSEMKAAKRTVKKAVKRTPAKKAAKRTVKKAVKRTPAKGAARH